MIIDNYLTYILIAITVTSIPGPAVLLNIKNSLQYGIVSSMYSIMGNFIAMLGLATLSALGLGTILLASSMLFFTVKILGACYLIYLGIQFFRSSSKYKIDFDNEVTANRSAFSLFKEAFMVGMSNPKAIIFFASLFPQFINPETSYFMQFTVLILTIEGISTAILICYVLLANKVSIYLLKKSVLNYVNKTIGFLFVMFGIVLMKNN